MSVLAKGLTEKNSRARENKRYTQGRVLAVNPLTRTCKVDVNEFLPDGTKQNLENVPYTPQTPPSIGDYVPLEYANSSTHSVRVGIGRLSGQNGGGTLVTVGGAPVDADYVVLTSNSTLTAEVQLGAGVIMRGVAASRPAASKAGRIYIATDTSVISRDNGASWDAIAAPDHGHTASGDGGNLATPNITNYAQLTNVSAPGTPASGKVRFYTKTDKKAYIKDDAGLETPLGGTTPTPTTSGVPYWRMKAYSTIQISTSALIDSEYFDSHTQDSGTNETSFPVYAVGPGGTFMWNGYGPRWVFWGRLGVANASGSTQTLNAKIMGCDDELVLYAEKPDNLAGTMSINDSTGVVTGSGTAFSTDFAVGDLLIGATDLRPLRVSGVTNNTSMQLADTGITTTTLNQSYRVAKKVCGQASGTGLTALSGTFAMTTGKTYTLHIFGHNNDTQYSFNLILDALMLTGCTFVDAGA